MTATPAPEPVDDDGAGDNRGDGGMTLVEVLVTMVLLGMCLAMFSTALLSAVRVVRRQTGVVDAQTSTRTAFLQLDKQIRYASSVSIPSSGTDPQWIEWQVPDPQIPLAQSSSQSRCYQWQASASAGTLKYRSWIVPSSGGASPTPWIRVATGLVIGSQPVFTTAPAALQAAPFLLPAAGFSVSLYPAQVGVALSVSLNNPPGRSAATSVFTALNSATAPSASVCTQVTRS